MAAVTVGLGSLVLALPASSALAAGKIKITAQVESVAKGEGSACMHPVKVQLSEGSRDVGEITVQKCAATGTDLDYSGVATLEIGKLKGHLHFGVAFHPVPPDFTAPKSGSGEVRDAKGAEHLTVVGPNLPSEAGASFTILLNPKVSFPGFLRRWI